MPINIIYDDPQALGEYAYYASGRRRRRENLDRSIDRQLQADQANAQLALNYEQLYRNVAQRNLDREAQFVDNVAQREAHAAYQLRAIDANVAAQQTADERRMAELDRRHELELQRRKFELDEPRRREAEVAERNLRQLEKMIQAEGRDPNEEWVRKARRDLTNLRDGIIFSAPPKEPPPDPLQLAIAQGRAKDLGGGSYLMMQPDGRLERIDTNPNEALEREAEAEREKRMQERYAGIEQTLLKQRDREWEARLKAWERNPVGEPPKHPGFPAREEVLGIMRGRGAETDDDVGGQATPQVSPFSLESMTLGAAGAHALATPGMRTRNPYAMTPAQAQAERQEIEAKYGRVSAWPPEVSERFNAISTAQQQMQELTELRGRDPKTMTAEEAKRVIELMQAIQKGRGGE